MQSTALNQVGSDGSPDQCLVFILRQQLYAVPILAVQEIRRYSEPTPLPNAPPYVLGLINLRGTVIPVFDLRMRFGVPSPVYDRLTVIVIVIVGERNVGIVADDVSKVLTLGEGDVRPSPEMAAQVDLTFVQGVLREGERLVTLLDVERLLGPDLRGIE